MARLSRQSNILKKLIQHNDHQNDQQYNQHYQQNNHHNNDNLDNNVDHPNIIIFGVSHIEEQQHNIHNYNHNNDNGHNNHSNNKHYISNEYYFLDHLNKKVIEAFELKKHKNFDNFSGDSNKLILQYK